MTKLPMLFILDRRTGKPIYGVEERPVPKRDVPGEWYSPTQPFPIKPPPLGRQTFSADDIAKITPEDEQACRGLMGKLGPRDNRSPFTPARADGALSFPSANGGALWSGGTFDPKLGYYIINTTASGSFWMIRKQDSDPTAPAESPRLYGRNRRLISSSTAVRGWPCWPPLRAG